jgi:hypothetical protein
MNTKLKTTIVTALLLIASVSGLVAQDKYDLIMAWVDPSKPLIHIVQNDVEAKTIETGKKILDMQGQYQRLLSEISKLTAQGWEIINVSQYTYYLKRKRQ